jgi:hypothetical protein
MAIMVKTVKICLQGLSLALILIALFFTGGCTKNETVTPVIQQQPLPVFKMEHSYISVGGKDYIQFLASCTSDNIKLFKATINDPGNKRSSFDYFSDTTDYQVLCKNESFTFPEDFPKQSGIWKFTFTGQRYKDNSDFISILNDTIAN